jgi:ribosomal protein S18 acetylase RimI-like enzyme
MSATNPGSSTEDDGWTRDEVREELTIRTGVEGLTPARVATLYRRAPLLRPVDDLDQLWEMFEHSSLIISAWYRDRLVGIARVLTDTLFISYLCDLAVEPDVQRLGIGRSLINEVLEHTEGTELVLRDSDISSSFYDQLGFERVDNAWAWPRDRSNEELMR